MALGGRVMDFTIDVPLLLHMFYTEFGQYKLGSFRVKAKNV